jgi:hypothetical protein
MLVDPLAVEEGVKVQVFVGLIPWVEAFDRG